MATRDSGLDTAEDGSTRIEQDDAAAKDGESTFEAGVDAPSHVDGDAGEPDAHVEVHVPTLLIIVDQSSSMFTSGLNGGGHPGIAGYSDAWELTRGGLTTVLPEFEGLKYGLVTFRDEQETCPLIEQLLEFDVHHAEASSQVLLANVEAIPLQVANTPVGNAVEWARARFAGQPVGSARYQLIITDGEPNTCAVRSPQCGQDRAVAAIQDAFDDGIRTFVVGVGSEIGGHFLEQAAQAGQGYPVPPPHQDDLWCIQQELSLASFDFEKWRDSALGVYAEDGYEPVEPKAYVIESEEQLLESFRHILTQVTQ